MSTGSTYSSLDHDRILTRSAWWSVHRSCGSCSWFDKLLRPLPRGVDGAELEKFFRLNRHRDRPRTDGGQCRVRCAGLLPPGTGCGTTTSHEARSRRVGRPGDTSAATCSIDPPARSGTLPGPARHALISGGNVIARGGHLVTPRRSPCMGSASSSLIEPSSRTTDCDEGDCSAPNRRQTHR